MQNHKKSGLKSEQKRPSLGWDRTRSLILFLFFFSGAVSLIYEVVWTRMFGLVFGNTVFATSTVLAVFMGGLALGSYYLGRLADHQENLLRLYANLEAGIGLFAFLIPTLLHLLNPVYIEIFKLFPENPVIFALVRFVFASLILIVPTTLMGGTLPVLSKYFMRQPKGEESTVPPSAKKRKGSEPQSNRTASAWGRLGRFIGNLYSVNTWGAVTGTFAAGFFMIEKLGVKETIYAAGAVNLLIAMVIFWVLSAQTAEEKRPVQQEGMASLSGKKRLSGLNVQRIIVAGMFLSGMAALAYEVLWNRLLVFLLTASTYAFTIMLLSFLVGIAFGSWLMARVVDRLKNPLLWFAGLEATLGVFGFFSLMILGKSVGIFDWAVHAVGVLLWWRWNLVQLFVALVVMLIPTTLMGATFPLAVRIFTRKIDSVGEDVGMIYSANTLGGVLGSLLAGFVLVPALGTQNSLMLVAAINFGIALLIVFQPLREARRLRWMIVGVTAALYTAALLWIPKDLFLSVFNISHKNSKIIYYDEGITSTVTVHEYSGGKRSIYTNNVQVAGTDFDMRTTQVLQGHIPLLLHPHPKRVMQVGFGTGETGHIVSLYPVQAIEGVEISPEVIRAAIYFESINGGIFRNPIFHKVIMDGRNYAMLTQKVYDIIMNDSIHPNVSHNASLYTVDYFRYCRSKLADDGIMSSWFPLFGLPLRDFKIIIKSFQTVFPHCSVWIANNCRNRHALLVGWKKEAPLSIDYTLMKKKLADPEIKASLDDIHMGDIFSILDAFVLDEKAAAAFTKNVPVHTDDHPILEFDAPRVEGSDEAVWAKNLEAALAYRTPVAPFVKDIAPSGDNPDSVRNTLNRFYQASSYIWKGQIQSLRGEHLRARVNYLKALAINPDDKDAAYLIKDDRIQEEALKMHLERTPEDWENQVRLGVRLLGEGKLAEAEQRLKFALRLNPKSPEARANLGLAYLYQKKWDAAIEELKAALKRDPTLVEAQYNLGFAYLQRDQSYTEAISEWEKAVKIDPEYSDAHYNLGLAYWKIGQPQKAIQELETARKLEPGTPLLYKLLGRLYESQKDYPRAIQNYKLYLESAVGAKDAGAIQKRLANLEERIGARQF
ncbi:MAG: tetratricopeptide repeat protein [Calditrichaeota bacterium]|nr:tetratricopeptide repeat protein [Calditrichota bacterium]